RVSDFTVGVLFSTFAVCGLIAGPIWGNISDRIGRKGVLIISQIGATIGWVILAFAPSIFIVFVARIIEGLSGGNIGVTQAYAADLVEPKERTRAYSYIAAAFSAGFTLGPAIGGLVNGRFGFTATFLLAAALQALTLILTITMLPESTSRQNRDDVASLDEITANLKNRRTAPVLWQKLAISLGLYAWFAVFALYLQAALGFTASQTMFMFAAYGVFNTLLQVLLVGRLSDALGDRWTSTLGLTTLVAGFALVAFAHTLFGVAIVFALFGIGMCLTTPTITSLISEAAPANQRGTILSVASSLDSFSGVITPMASTAVLGRYGSPFAGIVPLCFEFVALVVGLFSTKREPHQTKSDVAATPLSEEELAEA
ncbi:MAG: MFS transporter, partial [Candidatus Eremiobacteraeota bacterium]|nr:MFS transporter [Candidatus Eremiobacteraeota bacterium]